MSTASAAHAKIGMRRAWHFGTIIFLFKAHGFGAQYACKLLFRRQNRPVISQSLAQNFCATGAYLQSRISPDAVYGSCSWSR